MSFSRKTGDTSPFLSGNHLTPTAIGTTYARPIPAPPRIPIQSNFKGKLAPTKLLAM